MTHDQHVNLRKERGPGGGEEDPRPGTLIVPHKVCMKITTPLEQLAGNFHRQSIKIEHSVPHQPGMVGERLIVWRAKAEHTRR